jgi:hypothetical protein
MIRANECTFGNESTLMEQFVSALEREELTLEDLRKDVRYTFHLVCSAFTPVEVK